VASWEFRARRRRRRLALAAVPAMLALLAVTGFTAYAVIHEPTHLESIGCYDRASLDAPVTVVDADGRAPTDICAEVWTGAAGPGESDSPKLAACVLPTGAVGVFPGSAPSTCSFLGLSALPPSYNTALKGFAALRAAIYAKVGEPASGASRGGPQCVGEPEARNIVLDAHGYGDWEVRVAGGQFSVAQPCADVSFDTAGKTVFLLPIARDGRSSVSSSSSSRPPQIGR
jgi:hypothetical protein